MNIIVMEHFNSILFDKSGPANKQHSYQSITIYMKKDSHGDRGPDNSIQLQFKDLPDISSASSG